VNLSGFVAEMRERKVIRLALLYAVVGWVLIEAADVIFPALLLPDWAVRMMIVFVLAGFPVALILSWMFDATPTGVRRADARGGVAPAPSRAPSPSDAHGVAGPRSIAVLPFVDMSADGDNEFFSDGMTEEILNALTRVREIHVASRTSSFAFKGRDLDIREIAGKLNVATILEGSVRKSGDQLRITAQLINADDGYHLWSENYDRKLEDVFRVQDEIARSIVDALRVELDLEGSRSLVSGATDDMEAYTLYLKGRYVYNKFRRADLKKSLSFYEEALEKDPGYARAYAGIADSLMSLADDWLPPDEAYPRAEEAARRAIELDDTLAEAHTALGKVLGWYRWDFDRGELHLRRAVANNPSYAEGHFALGSVLPSNGNLEEGLTEIREAVSLDPLSCEYTAWVARFLVYLGRYEEAIGQCAQTIELDPTYYYSHVRLGQALLGLGRPEEALAAFRNHATRAGGVASVRAYEAMALAALGMRQEAESVVAQLIGDPGAYVRSEFLAGAYGAIGDLDRAFEALERAYDERSGGLIYLHLDPMYEPLRGDPRYANLVERIGLVTG
jgi:adenylate cyclase